MKALSIKLLIIGALSAAPLVAQAGSELETAVMRAADAWVNQDYRRLVAGSDTVRLNLPGLGRAPSVRPTQAARVLRDYLGSATEKELALRSIRRVNEDHAYAEMARVYTVAGTSDERVETVFLGFRRVEGTWRVREVRIAP